MTRNHTHLAALITFSLAAGVMAARTTAAFMRWAVQRTLAVEW
jgi:hypothetical protein